MFFRLKPSGERQYLQIVENQRDGAKTRQRVIATLGRADELAASGQLDVLLRSGARLCETAMLVSSLREGTLDGATTRRIGASLVFGRLWEESGCRAVIEGLVGRRAFAFPMERAIFATVLHRLMVSGSDRACERWKEAYRIDGAQNVELHHLYRAMAWLGEELADQSGATRAPRRTKDVIEERLFERRRSLFSDLSVVLFDTTSLYFHGAGGQTLGRRGKSKDHRPDLRQVIVGVVLDTEGRPICSETWPGNCADVKSLLPVVDRLRQRFAIPRMCVVADRGMISEETMAALKERGIDYILGARERVDKEVQEIVLADAKPMVAITIPRARGKQTTRLVQDGATSFVYGPDGSRHKDGRGNYNDRTCDSAALRRNGREQSDFVDDVPVRTANCRYNWRTLGPIPSGCGERCRIGTGTDVLAHYFLRWIKFSKTYHVHGDVVLQYR